VRSWTVFRQWAGDMLSRPWWVGLGVVLATAVAVVGYFLAAGGSPATPGVTTVHGNCNAVGSGNTVTCASPVSGTSP
jgi:hypothetical protein